MAKKVKSKRVEKYKQNTQPSLVNLVYGVVTVVIFVVGAFFVFRISSQKELGKDLGKITDESAQIEKQEQSEGNNTKNTYVVQSGDTLWSISEKFYKSGYNWADIVKTNNIENADLITPGMKLSIPDIAPKVATVVDSSVLGAKDEKIQSDSYTVMQRDNLWTIAQRAYGDGFRWTDIAKENKLVNPHIIHSGNVLKIPR